MKVFHHEVQQNSEKENKLLFIILIFALPRAIVLFNVPKDLREDISSPLELRLLTVYAFNKMSRSTKRGQ